MLIKVNTKGDIRNMNQLIRTEDISQIHEDPYESSKTIVYFYDGREQLCINEDFDSFAERFISMELDYFYEQGDEFGDEEFKNKINED